MKAMWAVVATALVFGSGCMKQDSIERTLVTVDVTGTWHGGSVGSVGGEVVVLDLSQEGARVTGSMRFQGGGSMVGAGAASPGPLEGTVSGDVFRFKTTRGDVEGELTVTGDEMTGQMTIRSSRQITLRRGDPSSSR